MSQLELFDKPVTKKIINNIEKKLGFSVNSIRVELQNSQQ